MPHPRETSTSTLSGGPFTVASLAEFPPADYKGCVIWLTDLFGTGDSVSSNGIAWRPARSYGVQKKQSANLTLQPLVDAPIQIIEGSIPVATVHNITLGTQNAWLGATFEIARRTTGLGTLTVNGAIVGINNFSKWVYTGSAWESIASGGLL